jgi:pyruvate ferredoxin oxidoreductase gamma subunit
MAAFTRIAREPIFERGAIARPNLVVVADETLLTEPASQPLAGCDSGCTLLLNTTKDEREIRALATHGGRIYSADFTALALRLTHTLASLSTALGVAAARLVGLTFEQSLQGVDDALSNVSLSASQRTANRQLAQTVYAHGQSWAPVRECPENTDMPSVPLVEVTFAPPAQAAPSIYAVGNSPQRQTGNWRQFRPVLHADRCTRCWLCFVWCPEGAIALDPDEYPVVDYTVCKGCLLCAHECPTQALSIEQEVR